MIFKITFPFEGAVKRKLRDTQTGVMSVSEIGPVFNWPIVVPDMLVITKERLGSAPFPLQAVDLNKLTIHASSCIGMFGHKPVIVSW